MRMQSIHKLTSQTTAVECLILLNDYVAVDRLWPGSYHVSYSIDQPLPNPIQCSPHRETKRRNNENFGFSFLLSIIRFNFILPYSVASEESSPLRLDVNREFYKTVQFRS